MKIFCDGGSRGNPGPAASAFVVYQNGDEDNPVHKEAKFLGATTNNVAEYTALIMALEWISSNASGDAEIILDSELVKKQMTGEYRIKNENLKALAAKAKALEGKNRFSIKYTHTLREGNDVADALVNTSLDSETDV